MYKAVGDNKSSLFKCEKILDVSKARMEKASTLAPVLHAVISDTHFSHNPYLYKRHLTQQPLSLVLFLAPRTEVYLHTLLIYPRLYT